MPQLFGEKLRKLRRQQKLTQAELAQQLDLASHAHVANIERGQDVPSLALVLRIARLFGVAIDYLLRDAHPTDQILPSILNGQTFSTISPSLFGEKLRALREQNNLNQIELARQLSLARQGYVSNLETGRKSPSISLVVQIANLFSVTTDYLLLDEIPVASALTGSA